MAADSTFLVDKQAPGFSSKLERLVELLEELALEEDRKVVLFSEWTTMLTLIERKIAAPQARLRAAGRLGPAEEAPAAGAPVPA